MASFVLFFCLTCLCACWPIRLPACPKGSLTFLWRWSSDRWGHRLTESLEHTNRANDWLIWVSETEAIARGAMQYLAAGYCAKLIRVFFFFFILSIHLGILNYKKAPNNYMCPLKILYIIVFAPFTTYRPGLVALAWQAWVVLAVLCVFSSLLQVAEWFAACAEVSEQVAMFLVGDGGALCADMNGPRCAVVIPYDRIDVALRKLIAMTI